jgi:hypothetical protein
VNLPPWVHLTIGGLVTAFGVYRLLVARRSKADEEKARERGGLYGLPRRTHLLVGIVYILMGAMLIAGAFGWSLARM